LKYYPRRSEPAVSTAVHLSPPLSPALSRREERRFRATLAVAVLFHTTVVALAASLREPIAAWVVPPAPTPATTSIAVEVALDAHGGGSLRRGEDERPRGAAPPQAEPQAAEPDAEPSVAPPLPPAPVAVNANVEQSLSAAAAPDTSDAYDLSALDTMLTESETAETLRRPRAARVTFARRSGKPAPAAGAKTPSFSRHYGVGPGSRGGQGWSGPRLGTGKVVSEEFAFGGPSGAFRGRVCFIAENTRSLSSVGACPTEVEFFTDVIDVAPRHFARGFPGISERIEWFSILYTGTFKVTHAGVYAFRVVSDDGALLHVDGRLVVDNDGIHGPRDASGRVHLNAETHELRVHYFQGPRTMVALQVFVRPPGAEERLLGPSL
jgi:hypothetical protein